MIIKKRRGEGRGGEQFKLFTYKVYFYAKSFFLKKPLKQLTKVLLYVIQLKGIYVIINNTSKYVFGYLNF